MKAVPHGPSRLACPAALAAAAAAILVACDPAPPATSTAPTPAPPATHAPAAAAPDAAGSPWFKDIAESSGLAFHHDSGHQSRFLMPEINGFETALCLRQIGGMADVPIMFVSARATQADQEAGRAAGGRYYLTKPFRRQELLDAIVRVLADDGEPPPIREEIA